MAIMPGRMTRAGKSILGMAAISGRAAGGGHGVGRHGALHHEKVGAPVAEGEHETQAHHHPEPADAHRDYPARCPCVSTNSVQVPGSKTLALGDGDEFLLESGPAADVLEREKNQGREAEHDHEELEDLVVDRRGEAAEEDVDQHDDGGDGDAGVIVPAQSSFRAAGPGRACEMPEEKTVMTAKEMALKPRVFSSKRSLRYSGTERALEP